MLKGTGLFSSYCGDQTNQEVAHHFSLSKEQGKLVHTKERKDDLHYTSFNAKLVKTQTKDLTQRNDDRLQKKLATNRQ